MSYRKKRLLIIQIILTTIAIILAYIFYYKGNDQNDLRTTSEISSDITNQEEAQENFFENVEYRGIEQTVIDIFCNLILPLLKKINPN